MEFDDASIADFQMGIIVGTLNFEKVKKEARFIWAYDDGIINLEERRSCLFG